jgi:DNA-binding transcriptional LysR family regulator
MREFDNLQIRKVDAGLLLIFRELMARRRASDVAQHLGLSASAISHALGRLRELFGEPLFIRRSHGLEPTQKAVDLAPAVERLLSMIDDVVSPQRAFDPGESRRRFRIGAPDWLATLIAPGLVDAFRSEAPGATFSTRWAITERALRAVHRGESDIALGSFGAIPQALVAEALYEEYYCVIARQGHPFVDGGLTRRTYATAGHLFVGNPDGTLDNEPIDRPSMNAAYGALPVTPLIDTQGYVTQWETAMLAVSGSDVLADCPHRLAGRFAERLGLQVLEPPFRPFRFTVQAVRRAEPADAGVDWLMSKVRAAIAA